MKSQKVKIETCNDYTDLGLFKMRFLNLFEALWARKIYLFDKPLKLIYHLMTKKANFLTWKNRQKHTHW